MSHNVILGAVDLPEQMSYALRFPEKPRLNSFFSSGGSTWRTDQIFPNYETSGPRFAYSNEGGNDPGNKIKKIFTSVSPKW